MLPVHLKQPTQGLALLVQKAAGFCCTHENRVSICCFSYCEILEVLWETLPRSNAPHNEIKVLVVTRLKVWSGGETQKTYQLVQQKL